MKKILFISGSMRKESHNTALLKTAAEILSPDFDCSFLSYDDIPYINQELEANEPEEIKRVRAEVRKADAIWIASPEYNHSYSGVLKNLLDWLSRPTVPGDYSTAVIRGKLTAISSVAGNSAGSFSLEKLSELLLMLGCTIIPQKTGIALGPRFGSRTLELTAEELSSLKEECQALKDSI